MTLEEKAGLCSGSDFWHTKAVERLQIPGVMVSDGPHGIRKQGDKADHLGNYEAVKAVCFPTASALACSFDNQLIYELGEYLGEECQAEKVSTLLGPGVNMKRSPLCGRNFEYYSEDPYLAGEIGAAFVNGVQSKNIGTSLKHFAANNQEYRRLSISAKIDERTLREIYLTAFEKVVKQAKPWTIMCSYNRINGLYSCENNWLLNQVLREEWGFEGVVVTDWGAMNDRVRAIQAGLDLEMPSCDGYTDQQLVEAVKTGKLSEEYITKAAERVVRLIQNYTENQVEGATYDKEAHHKFAKRVETECAVLLKNEKEILPLSKESKVAFIGGFAANPRYQGGGSSHINSSKVTNALDASKKYQVTYATGFRVEQIETDEMLLSEAIKTAKNAEIAVIFAGLPESFESEGFDRSHMDLPECQNRLIEEICKVQEKVVVVLHNGAPVTMPWVDRVKGILELYLGGQAVGEAAVELLYGDVNPSGKLAETFPIRLEDNPSYLNFPGTRWEVAYQEGIYIGYRYYDSKKMPVLFPFGHGLSYTNFEYDNMKVRVVRDGKACLQETGCYEVFDTDQIEVEVTVKNTGKCSGKEAVQFYIAPKKIEVNRPAKELKRYEKVSLATGEEKTVVIRLEPRDFSYYDVEKSDWRVSPGEYEILVGSSSRDIRLTKKVVIKNRKQEPFKVLDYTTFGDIDEYLNDNELMNRLVKRILGESDLARQFDDPHNRLWLEMFQGMPIHASKSFKVPPIENETVEQEIENLLKER